MRCDRERVSSFRDNLLSPAERAAFEEHLAGCPTCQRTLAAYASVGQAIRAMPMVSAPNTMRRVVMTIAPRRAARKRTVWLPAASGFAGASLAMALLVVLFIQFRASNQAVLDTQSGAGAAVAMQPRPPSAEGPSAFGASTICVRTLMPSTRCIRFSTFSASRFAISRRSC